MREMCERSDSSIDRACVNALKRSEYSGRVPATRCSEEHRIVCRNLKAPVRALARVRGGRTLGCRLRKGGEAVTAGMKALVEMCRERNVPVGPLTITLRLGRAPLDVASRHSRSEMVKPRWEARHFGGFRSLPHDEHYLV
jgi:hypothetical protein